MAAGATFCRTRIAEPTSPRGSTVGCMEIYTRSPCGFTCHVFYPPSPHDTSLDSGVEMCYAGVMFKVEVEQETDGRWIAEVPELPGVITYGASREEAVTRAQALSLRVLAERLEHGEDLPQVEAVFSIVAA